MTGPSAGFSDSLPAEVVECAKRIEATPHLAPMAELLIDGRKKDLVTMWRAIERASRKRGMFNGDEWVVSFLIGATWAAEAEPFRQLPMKKRKEKAELIKQRAAQLARELRDCGLDVHLVRPPKHSFWGWLYYEDMSESNQQRSDASREPRLNASSLIEAVAERAAAMLENEPYLGKAGKQAMAVRFCRRLAEMNELTFGEGVLKYQVVATAVNAVYGTNYTEQAVRDLIAG